MEAEPLPKYKRAVSSNVLCYRYIPWVRTLMIRFRSDPTTEYWYYGVPKEMADAFAASPSRGRWVWDNLRPERNGGVDPFQWEKFTGLRLVGTNIEKE